MAIYHDSPSGVNPQSQPQPGYYAVIPAPVRYCKGIPAAGKLLYGELTALCSVEGYCWAANSYFAALYDVDESTIRRWLAALVKHGFIKVFVSGPKRRIYLAEAAPKQAKSRAKTSGLPAQKQAAYPRKNAPHSITLNRTLISTSEDARGRRFVGPGPVAAGKLQGQEGKGSASPPLSKASPALEVSASKIRHVERAVAACRDLTARKTLQDLWDAVEGAGCVEVWRDGLDAVKTPSKGATGLVGPSAARFVAVVVSSLAARGVAVPAGLERA